MLYPRKEKKTPYHIGINGITGKMGERIFFLLLKEKNLLFAGGTTKSKKNKGKDIGSFFGQAPLGKKIDYSIDSLAKKVDLLIDFSSVEALPSLITAATTYSIPLVIGTTGFSTKQLKDLSSAAKKIPILLCYNFSLGIALCKNLLKKIAYHFPFHTISITEEHHKEKKDCPSGTALLLKKEISDLVPQKEISIHSIRKGKTIGKHSISFESEKEKIILTHTALNRDIFAKGAIAASHFLLSRPPSLYSLDDVMESYNI